MSKWAIIAGSAGLLISCQAVPAETAQKELSVETGAAVSSARIGPSKTSLEGSTIIALAHDAAGGDTFVDPGSLFLSGYNVIYGSDGGARTWDKYAMWRVFADEKADAHAANGKVRIEAWQGSKLAMLLSFDGEATYNQSGRMEDQSANAMWSNNFGFGAIRNALDEGWTQERRADRTVDGKPAYMVQLTDPSGGKTLFGFDRSTLEILYVGFDTPRGWHERRYSDYFSKPGTDWQQAGRVRLFYNGVMANEAVWTDFEIGDEHSDETFVISETLTKPSFD
ncbi:MAG: hypothetical protein AAFQ12_02045 [Pseudomonadota bacterium]